MSKVSKIFYSRISKLVVYGIVMIFTFMLSKEGYAFFKDYIDYDKQMKEAKSYYEMECEGIRDEIEELLIKEMNDALNSYDADKFSDIVQYFHARNLRNDRPYLYYVVTDLINHQTNIPQIDVTGRDFYEVDDYCHRVMINALYDNETYYNIAIDTSIRATTRDANKAVVKLDEWINGFGESVQDKELEIRLNKIDNAFMLRIYLEQSYVDEMYESTIQEYANMVKEISEPYDNQIEEIQFSVVVYVIGLLISVIVLIFMCGKTVEGPKTLNRWERYSTDTHILSIIALIIIVEAAMQYVLYEEIFYSIDTERNVFMLSVSMAMAFVYYEIGVLISKIRNKCFLSDVFIVRIVKKFWKWVLRKTEKTRKKIVLAYDRSAYISLPQVKRKHTIRIIIDTIVIIISCITILNAYITGAAEVWEAMGLIALVLFIGYVSKSLTLYSELRKYNNISKAIDNIAEGNYRQIAINNTENDPILAKMSGLSDSFEESVKKQVEAEKMQIELVANVSHDLKTPLTSIISYVDLLREEEMSDIAKDYVKVLVDKSARLKSIVADVFDLAKATSGQDIETEQLDGVVLINQVLSDMSDKIESMGGDIRLSMNVDVAPITGHSQKLYRVLQNIIDNALKYSMKGTRIYVNCDMIGEEFVIKVKNVSRYEIDFTGEEIMSRFTRGDKARHSEGNGLGLSIAKSFTELIGGSFEVELDGDLFTAIVKLKKYM